MKTGDKVEIIDGPADWIGFTGTVLRVDMNRTMGEVTIEPDERRPDGMGYRWFNWFFKNLKVTEDV